MENVLKEIIITSFPECKHLITDNEASFVTPAIKQMCYKYGIQKLETPGKRTSQKSIQLN